MNELTLIERVGCGYCMYCGYGGGASVECLAPRSAKADIHADDIKRGAVRVNAERFDGHYCVLVPDPEIVGRWNTIASFRSLKQAETYAAGYCARRDGKTL